MRTVMFSALQGTGKSDPQHTTNDSRAFMKFYGDNLCKCHICFLCTCYFSLPDRDWSVYYPSKHLMFQDLQLSMLAVIFHLWLAPRSLRMCCLQGTWRWFYETAHTIITESKDTSLSIHIQETLNTNVEARIGTAPVMSLHLLITCIKKHSVGF